jgi:hypothetical protein
LSLSVTKSIASQTILLRDWRLPNDSSFGENNVSFIVKKPKLTRATLRITLVMANGILAFNCFTKMEQRFLSVLLHPRRHQ